MKNLKNILLIMMLVGVSYSFGQSKDKITMKVNGLGCPYCSIGFVKKIKQMGEVSDIDTDYEKGLFFFSINPGDDISLEKLQSTTKKAGYTLVYANIDYANKKDIVFGSM